MKYAAYPKKKVYHILDPEPKSYGFINPIWWTAFLCGCPLGWAKIYKSRPKNKRICKICAKSIRRHHEM